MSELEPTRTYSNPTANDILRRMLDERGVEHEDDEDVTRFFGPDGFEVVMQEDIDGKLDCLTPLYLTPEQAIAATLGAGTCHDKNGFDVTLGFECTVCGAMTDGYMLSPADTGHYKQFNFCPMCGRRVEQ